MSRRRLIVVFVVGILCALAYNQVGRLVADRLEIVQVTPAYAGTEYVAELPKNGLPLDDITLVSWNACNFGKKKSQEAIVRMSQILRSADIVAVEEVSTSDFGAQAVAKLADELNRTGAMWDYVVSDATHDSPCKERFAFLWKTKRVAAVPYKATLCAGLASSMVREPAKIDLEIDKKFYLTLISFHLAPTAKHPEHEVLALPEHAQEFSNANIVFVGDFNLGHDKLVAAFERGLGAKHYIEGETSLKAKEHGGGVRSYLSKEYDNVFTRGSIRVDRSLIVDFVPQCGDLRQARMVSDHLPVAIVCNLK